MSTHPNPWSAGEPPTDGTWIVARGCITWTDANGGGSAPFLREVRYAHQGDWSGWLDRDGVALEVQVDDRVHVHHWIPVPGSQVAASSHADRFRNAVARRYLAARLAEDECVRGYEKITEREKVTGVHEWDEGLRLLKQRNRWWRRGLHLMHAVNPAVELAVPAFRDPIMLTCESWSTPAMGRSAA